MSAKIKFTFGQNVVARLPYKSGYVEYTLRLMYNHEFKWELTRKPDIYQRDRVERSLKQYLAGRRFRGQLLRAAAASHNWYWFEKIKGEFRYQDKIRNKIDMVVERDYFLGEKR